MKLLVEDELRDVVLLIFANKQVHEIQRSVSDGIVLYNSITGSSQFDELCRDDR